MYGTGQFGTGTIILVAMSSPCRRIVPHLLSLVKLLLLLQWSIPRSTAFVLSSRVISRQYPNPYMPAGARVTNWRQRTKRPSSHGAIGDALRVLKAALEVFPAERVEPGCVLWASEENYGHSTFKVRRTGLLVASCGK